MFGDFYTSDMIVASPLGLVTVRSFELPVIFGLYPVKRLFIFLTTNVTKQNLNNYMVIIEALFDK